MPGNPSPTPPATLDADSFARLHAAVTSDWGPRDAYERRWVMELVTCLWRQDRLRALELASLTAAAAESPPGDAAVGRLTAFARYGARIDKDIGRALQALRILRDRPDAWIDELKNGTAEPGKTEPAREAGPREPAGGMQRPKNGTPEPERPGSPLPAEPAAPPNRQQRRRLAALARGRRAA
ncbi:MAG: hypothetical protein U1E52_08385 [Geminicoccaceae bacterium]